MIKRGIYCLILICTHQTCIYAQVILASTQNSTGLTSSSSNGYILTYSVGELASIEHFIAPNNYMLSTGLLQTFSPLVTALNEIAPFERMPVTIFPNPTSQYLHVAANYNQSGQVQIQLLDAQSKIKYKSEPNSIFNQFQKNLDIGNYPAGVYYLKIQFQPNLGQTRVGVYKIIKL